MGKIYHLAKLIILVVVVLTNSSFQAKNSTMKNIKITYYYDALCGWCFGFSPVFKEIHKTYHAKIDFEVISGGLFLGDRVGPINEVAPYIKAGAYKTVESTTGVIFGKGFVERGLEQGNMIMNSLYPAMALCVVKSDYPQQVIPFVGLLHQAFYVDGKNPEDIEMYGDYAAQLGINKAVFNEKMQLEVFQKQALEEFSLSSQQNIGGFPALVLEVGGKKTILSSGYTSYEVLERKMEAILID